MAVAQWFQVKYRYHIAEHILENVVNYRQTVEGTDANPAKMLLFAWDAEFIDKLAAVQSVFVFNDFLDCTDLLDPEINHRVGVGGMGNGGGTVTGDRGQFWDAYVWTKTPVNRSFKTGLFRLRGVTENWSFGEDVNPDNFTAFNAITASLSATLTGTDGSTFIPIVLRKRRMPLDPALPFQAWAYQDSLISGINFKRVGHLVNNK